MKRVEGHQYLYRDETGAIINRDDAGYRAYKKSRDAADRKDETIKGLEENLNTAMQEIAELRELIKVALKGNIDK